MKPRSRDSARGGRSGRAGAYTIRLMPEGQAIVELIEPFGDHSPGERGLVIARYPGSVMVKFTDPASGRTIDMPVVPLTAIKIIKGAS